MPPSWKENHRHLPAVVDPIQLAERGACLSGTLPLKAMPRLAQSCIDDAGDVHVDLAFERSEGERIYLMHGQLRVQIRVICQRCLEAMELELACSPWLIVTRPSEGRHTLEGDPDVLVADKPLPLSSLVEDELLLAMPMVPMHALSDCTARSFVTDATGKTIQEDKIRPENPFSILSRLKKAKKFR